MKKKGMWSRCDQPLVTTGGHLINLKSPYSKNHFRYEGISGGSQTESITK